MKVAARSSVTTDYTYNKLDQLTALARGGSNQAKFVYDEKGNIISVSRSNGTYTALEIKFKFRKRYQHISKRFSKYYIDFIFYLILLGLISSLILGIIYVLEYIKIPGDLDFITFFTVIAYPFYIIVPYKDVSEK